MIFINKILKKLLEHTEHAPANGRHKHPSGSVCDDRNFQTVMLSETSSGGKNVRAARGT